MVMEVEIVSKELVKPSSPTPHHLRTHLLSFLDQFLPSIYVPMVLFYMNQETGIPSADIIADNSRRAQLLKESLSETLTLFYPFAGRIEEHHLSVDCNDEGAYYVKARVNSRLREFLELTDSSYVPQLLPATSAGGYVSMIHLSRAAALPSDHVSCTWSSMQLALQHFLENAAFSKEATSTLMTTFLKERTCRTTIIVFDASAIASLKARAASSSVSNPTQVEVILALLTKCIIATLKSKSDTRKSTLINHTVNLRQRAVPQIPKTSIGNFLCVAAALATENDTELDTLGWGKPTWVCKDCAESEAAIENTVLLMDTKMEDGIEALVFMEDQHLVMLEQNRDLLAFATLGQSALNLMI
ncbi:Pre-rRNA-processing protein TSR1 isoform 1 [Hibiscus syriacus]|uniref:Pre-rRNA-processing protein TSR1 isoform 1 n=1 Tax=Hibiscus syriacus TaxID=106335 RepID=A0A6A3AI31_HIBSY|nr:Pre-rRNA-processing protein TSR1 isoform 1 [Hibiscus syriacus]